METKLYILFLKRTDTNKDGLGIFQGAFTDETKAKDLAKNLKSCEPYRYVLEEVSANDHHAGTNITSSMKYPY